MAEPRLPILMYHALAGRPSPITITPACFARQMAELAASGCQVLALQEAARRLAAGLPLPRRAAVITFDDGYAGVYEHAWPVLERFGFPATIFLVAGFAGRDNRWPGQPPAIPSLPLLSWPQVVELDRHGLAFGVHTLTHPMLDRLPLAAADHEIQAARRLLEEHLGHPVDLFAYPYGRHTPGIKAVVAASYLAACGTELALARACSDRFALPRVEAAYLIHPSLIRRLWSPSFPAYLALRRRARFLANLALRRAWC